MGIIALTNGLHDSRGKESAVIVLIHDSLYLIPCFKATCLAQLFQWLFAPDSGLQRVRKYDCMNEGMQMHVYTHAP